MPKCGLLGEKLGHSYSPTIHSKLGNYEYLLYERQPDQVEGFVKGGDWDGLNVTIPYKKAVIPFCTELSARAARIGSVNTMVRRKDGSIYGDNTDAYGFEKLIKHSKIQPEGKKTLVLGSGGASASVCAVLSELGADVTVISREGEDNYENISRHGDAEIIVNTTPLGMYPKNGAAALDLRTFPKCAGVLDVVYNPARTALILQAEKLGIPCASGLYMLVAQAKGSAELFTGNAVDDGEIARIERELSRSMQNIVIIGMPGSGKTTISAELGKKLERPVYEADALIEEKAGMKIPELFRCFGEERFRELETQVLNELGKLSGVVISTGGGCVTREENYGLLHQNGCIIWLRRDVAALPTEGRPISLQSDMNDLYRRRLPMYRHFADCTADNNGDIEQTVRQIMEMLR